MKRAPPATDWWGPSGKLSRLFRFSKQLHGPAAQATVQHVAVAAAHHGQAVRSRALHDRVVDLAGLARYFPNRHRAAVGQAAWFSTNGRQTLHALDVGLVVAPLQLFMVDRLPVRHDLHDGSAAGPLLPERYDLGSHHRALPFRRDVADKLDELGGVEFADELRALRSDLFGIGAPAEHQARDPRGGYELSDL